MDRLMINLALTTFVFACSCAASPSSPTQPATVVEPAAAADENVPWADKSRAQRVEHMKAVVLPTIGPLFTAFDGERFAKPDCTLCHGSGAKDGTFTMPNPELPVLDFASPDFPSFAKKHGKALAFMKKTVWPETARAIGLNQRTAQDTTGFSCNSCHTSPQK